MEAKDIRARYIAALRALVPELRAWWDRMLTSFGEAGAFDRWPTGPSGHPRVLEIYRTFSFELEELNETVREQFDEEAETHREPDREAMWGRDDPGAAPRVERDVDWLIHDIEDAAPDLYALVLGIVFVPIGLDPNDETV